MIGDVTPEKLPFRHTPAAGFRLVEADLERCDQVEPAKWRQVLEGVNRPQPAIHPEQGDHLVIEGYVADIDADCLIAQEPGDIRKVACAGAEIEHASRRLAMKLQQARALKLHMNPILKIEVLAVTGGRIGIAIPGPEIGEGAPVDALCDSGRLAIGQGIPSEGPRRYPAKPVQDRIGRIGPADTAMLNPEHGNYLRGRAPHGQLTIAGCGGAAS